MVAAERAERLVEDLPPGRARQPRPEDDAAARLELARPVAQALDPIGQLASRDTTTSSLRAQHREDVGVPALLAHRLAQLLERARGDQVRRHGHRVRAGTTSTIDLAELARVLRVARGVVTDAALGVGQVRQRVDHVAARVARHAVLVDLVAEAVERLPEADDAAGVEAEELAHEGGDAPGPRRLVVLDDVAVLALLLEEVVDERLGLEREQVVDGRRHEEHAGGVCPRAAVRAIASTPVPASPSLSLRSTRARARARPAREEERVVAALDEDARVGLEDVLVEAVLEAPVDAVGAEVVHEEATAPGS